MVWQKDSPCDAPGDFYKETKDPCSGNVSNAHHRDGPMMTHAELMNSVSTDGQEEQDARFEMAGDPPQNESGRSAVCSMLADALTCSTGKRWVSDCDVPEGCADDGYVTCEDGTRWAVRENHLRTNRDPSSVAHAASITQLRKSSTMGRHWFYNSYRLKPRTTG